MLKKTAIKRFLLLTEAEKIDALKVAGSGPYYDYGGHEITLEDINASTAEAEVYLPEPPAPPEADPAPVEKE